jgi:hypothetical protein
MLPVYGKRAEAASGSDTVGYAECRETDRFFFRGISAQNATATEQNHLESIG